MKSFLDRYLVPNWQRSWTWFSIHMHIVGTGVVGMLLLVPSMPPEVQAVVPLKYRAAALGGWCMLGLFARLKKQGASSDS